MSLVTKLPSPVQLSCLCWLSSARGRLNGARRRNCSQAGTSYPVRLARNRTGKRHETASRAAAHKRGSKYGSSWHTALTHAPCYANMRDWPLATTHNVRWQHSLASGAPSPRLATRIQVCAQIIHQRSRRGLRTFVYVFAVASIVGYGLARRRPESTTLAGRSH